MRIVSSTMQTTTDDSEQIQIKSFLLVYEVVKTTINDQVGWRGYMGRVIWV